MQYTKSQILLTAIKTFFVSLALVFLIGCSHSSQMSTYRPRGSNGDAWHIKVEKNDLTEHVVIIINDSTVASGMIGMFSSGEELKGEYQGHKILGALDKSKTWYGTERMHCLVMIDGELAGKFEF